MNQELLYMYIKIYWHKIKIEKLHHIESKRQVIHSAIMEISEKIKWIDIVFYLNANTNANSDNSKTNEYYKLD